MFPYAYYEFLSFLSSAWSGREQVWVGWTLDGRLWFSRQWMIIDLIFQKNELDGFNVLVSLIT